MNSSILPLGLAGLLFVAATGVALAHAHLVSAMPAENAIIGTPPTELELKFSEELDAKFSGVMVVGPGKDAVKTGATALAKGDEATLVVPLSETLGAGTYKVDWHVLSKDGHKTKGSFGFTVKP